MRQLINSIAVILLATACSNVPEPTAPPATPEPVNQHALKAHVEFLASDLLAGRDTGSDEYLIAANYVAAHFQSLDLTPAGDDGRYFQNVPL